MIDEDLKPYLIEVNHAPSFGTSSNVDLKVKGNLIRDTLTLLGINSEAKGNLLRIQARNRKEISLKGKKSLLADQEFRDHCLKERDTLMESNLGLYERVYPAQNSQTNDRYANFLD